MNAAPSTGDEAAVNLLEDIELAIFDKDGTLVDFHAMWGGWARDVGERIAAALDGRRFDRELDDALGIDSATGRVRAHGALAATPMARIRDLLVATLAGTDVLRSEAERAVELAWHAPDPVVLAHPLADLAGLFDRLAELGIRIAVATSDDRAPTEETLRHLGVENRLAAVVCADDGLAVKPDPAAVLAICDRLAIPARRAMVVGDAPADLAMGRAAGAGRVVGVLSGVGDAATLGPLADALVASVGELRPRG